MTISKFALIRSLRSPVALVFNCVLPIILILIRPLWTGDVTPGYGFLVMIIWGAAFLMAQSMQRDKAERTVVRILAAPVTMLNYMLQNMVAAIIPLLIQVALISSLGVLIYDWSVTVSLGLALCYTVFIITSVAMGFAWICLFKEKENSSNAFMFVISMGMFLSGVFMPVDMLPGILQYIGAIFPAYWAVLGIDHLLVEGMTTEYWLSILVMLLLGAVFLLYGGKRRII